MLTPRKLAEAIGVSESSVKRWVDAGHIVAARTAGGHRRIARRDAVSYIRARGLTVERPHLLGLPESTRDSRHGADTLDTELFECLQRGDAAATQSLLLAWYLEGSSLAEIVDGPLAGAMERIGELWEAGTEGIVREHRATQIALEALAALRSLIRAPDDAPVAVGGAPEGDPYLLAPLSAAAVLEDAGLRVRHLGAETPIAALALAVEEYDARLAYLSVSAAPDAASLRREIHRWLPQLEARGTALVVGGVRSSRLGLAMSETLYVGRSMAELVALVQGMRWAPRMAATSS